MEIFALFCSYDLHLDWMTFTYELDPYVPQVVPADRKWISTSRRL